MTRFVVMAILSVCVLPVGRTLLQPPSWQRVTPVCHCLNPSWVNPSITPSSWPDISAGFSGQHLRRLMNWTTGMVVQVDYLQIPDGGDITSADIILRRYFNNRGDRQTEVNIFLGLGSGISDIDRSDPDDVAAGEHWSILAEAGQEWFFKPTHMFFLKAQYRWMINAGRTWQGWTVMVGAGLNWE